jgi:light-harvesting complex 1 beta chain
MAETKSLSGLTEEEAKEFHKIYQQSFLTFVVIAVVAHILVWSWRPWLPPVGGYTTSMIDGVTGMLSFLA